MGNEEGRGRLWGRPMGERAHLEREKARGQWGASAARSATNRVRTAGGARTGVGPMGRGNRRKDPVVSQSKTGSAAGPIGGGRVGSSREPIRRRLCQSFNQSGAEQGGSGIW